MKMLMINHKTVKHPEPRINKMLMIMKAVKTVNRDYVKRWPRWYNLWLWLFPTYIFCDNGFRWYFKIALGKTYFVRAKKLVQE